MECTVFHDLFSLHVSICLSLEFFLLLLLLFPLFISNTSHDSLICLCLLLTIFIILLLFVTELLLNRLIPLLQEGLLQPLLEHSISRILLSMLAEPLKLLLLLPEAFILCLHRFQAFLLPALLLLHLRGYGLLYLILRLTQHQLLLGTAFGLEHRLGSRLFLLQRSPPRPAATDC